MIPTGYRLFSYDTPVIFSTVYDHVPGLVVQIRESIWPGWCFCLSLVCFGWRCDIDFVFFSFSLHWLQGWAETTASQVVERQHWNAHFPLFHHN